MTYKAEFNKKRYFKSTILFVGIIKESMVKIDKKEIMNFQFLEYEKAIKKVKYKELRKYLLRIEKELYKN